MRKGIMTTQGAKTVAQDRKVPRPLKTLVLTYHEEEVEVPVLKQDGTPGKKTELVIRKIVDSNGKPIPAVSMNFRVAVSKKMCLFINHKQETHNIEVEDGELDWSRGAVTVAIQFTNEDGTKAGRYIPLSHMIQYAKTFGAGSKNKYKEGKFEYVTSRQGGKVSQDYVAIHDPKNRFTNSTLRMWQEMANSPDATWIDGVKPSLKQLEAQAAERRLKAEDKQYKDLVEAAPQPAGITEGEDFDDFHNV